MKLFTFTIWISAEGTGHGAVVGKTQDAVAHALLAGTSKGLKKKVKPVFQERIKDDWCYDVCDEKGVALGTIRIKAADTVAFFCGPPMDLSAELEQLKIEERE